MYITQSVRTILESIIKWIFSSLLFYIWFALFGNFVLGIFLVRIAKYTYTCIPKRKVQKRIEYFSFKNNNNNLRISWVNRLMITSRATHVNRYIFFSSLSLGCLKVLTNTKTCDLFAFSSTLLLLLCFALLCRCYLFTLFIQNLLYFFYIQ